MSQYSKNPDLSAEEYLAQEEKAETRHEFINGQVFAMTGATEAHNLICGNLHALLHQHLRGSRCRPFIADMKVRIETANSFYYPDIMVTCEPFDAKSVFKRSPVLIAEVLSPSTKHIDRREKLLAYRQIQSLKEYLIVHQNRVRIEIYRKDATDQWEFTSLGKSDLLQLNSLVSAFEVPLSAIYEGVLLDSIVEEEEEDYILA